MARRVIWDRENRKHLLEEHPERGISKEEIDFVLKDARPEDDHWDERHGCMVTISATAAGRLLVVAWMPHSDDGRYPIHARPAGRRARREYSR